MASKRGELVDLWCILRTAGRSTLGLCNSLSGAGFEVWTPQVFADGQRCRSRSMEEAKVPMTPTYVFARARRLFDLIGLAANPGRDHEGFSVMRMPSGIPLVSDRGLEGLREEEEMSIARSTRARRRRERREGRGDAYARGELVRVATAGFTGLEGQVEQSDTRYTLLCFGGSMRLKIETFILRQDDVGDADTSTALAA